MCKIMQNIANHLQFTKENHMRGFNDILKNNFEAGRRYVEYKLNKIFMASLQNKVFTCSWISSIVEVQLGSSSKVY